MEHREVMVQAWAVIAYFLAFSRAWVAQASHEVDISVDLAKTHEVSDKLYGIFFEEVRVSLKALQPRTFVSVQGSYIS